jgi:ADP-ribose pyrophosphatase
MTPTLTQTLYQDKWLTLVRYAGWTYVQRNHPVVQIVAVTDDQDLVLVEQVRHPLREAVIELPAGLVDPGEKHLGAGARELLEETGYRARWVEPLEACPSSPGLTNEVSGFVVARALLREGDPEPGIKVHLVPLRSAPEWLMNQSRFVGVSVWAGLAMLEAFR